MVKTSPPRMDALFPRPTRPYETSPRRSPDADEETIRALIDGLKNNHVERDPFTDERGFHSHAAHHLLAVYAMGATGPVIGKVSKFYEENTRPTTVSPGVITRQNFYDHLGNRSYYRAYLQYFSDEVLEKGAVANIEEYIFAPEANVETDEEELQSGERLRPPPRMLNRLHSRLFHPMIHLGYGLEFGLPGLVAEGLAQTAVHPLEVLDYFPPALYQNAVPNSSRSTLAQERISLSKSSANSAVRRDCPSIFTIVARLQADNSLSSSSLCLSSQVDPTKGFDYHCQVGGLRCEALASHTQDWEVNRGDTQAVTRAIEELSFLNALLYGVCGWGAQHMQTSHGFKADFYLMHLLTSSIFLPTYAASLRPTSVSLLLKTYLLSSLTWWVARGRPNIPIHEFYSRTNPTSGKLSYPHTSSDHPCYPLIQDAIAHSDDHLCKVQRALLHFATVYGDRPAGHFIAPGNTQDATVDGQDLIDGTLFIRVAQLTYKRFRSADGAPGGNWDLRGFFPS